MIALLIIGIYLANGGGITQKVSQNLGLRDGVVRVYNQNAATNLVYVNIKGYWASDRTAVDGKYLIIGNEGKEFIVSNGEGVYKTGEQIITSKVTTTVGEAAVTEIRNLTFNDEEPIPALQEIQQNYPNSDVFVRGNLTVDFPEDIQIPLKKNNYTTVSLSVTTLKISYCSLRSAIVQRQPSADRTS